ncbi:hypothetical protein PLEOSDRAFT_168807 [Pleurotus ostreatus PC15]|uniref:Uncharacterized protein n=1 Tax=Pleurotus ostreatus (strain PC15) TaxID=1137138 RepID=A0A067NFU8_PLEO1|nr:hypothetical protein PLEOSDRAFT_168807 [Pleurotus ostreatus PC15]
MIKLPDTGMCGAVHGALHVETVEFPTRLSIRELRPLIEHPLLALSTLEKSNSWTLIVRGVIRQLRQKSPVGLRPQATYTLVRVEAKVLPQVKTEAVVRVQVEAPLPDALFHTRALKAKIPKWVQSQ